MALTVPSLDRLARHLRADSVEEAGWAVETAQDELQQATDLMAVATHLTVLPTDEVGARMVERGILAMAHALLVRGDDRDKEYNIFSSERIGSYSYSKAQSGEKSGIPDFDAAIEWASEAGGETEAWISSETVFTDPNPALSQDFDEFPYHHGETPFDFSPSPSADPA